MSQRARRGEELVRRELMSECTFRPKIKGLPQVEVACDEPDFSTFGETMRSFHLGLRRDGQDACCR